MSKISLLKNEYDSDLNQLKSEFFSLYQLFISNKNTLEHDSEVVLHLSYLYDLMTQHYQCGDVLSDLKDLEKNKKEAFINKNTSLINQHSTTKFSSFLLDGIKNNILDYASSFTRTSKLRGHLSSLNTNRLYWNSSRSLATHAIIYLQNSGFSDLIKEINEKIGHYYSSNDFIKALEKPQEILRALSVGLYVLRFILNLVTMAEHIIQAALNKELSSKEVLEREMEERGFTMVNDMVWGTVNLLTNYNENFHISSQAASQMTFIFLTFDVALLVARWSFEANKYDTRVHELMLQKRNLTPFSRELLIINQQLDRLNDEWEAQCAHYMINIIAVSLLATSFGATLLFSGPLALICLSALSMLGNALSNSANEYKEYKQASIAVQREVSDGKTSDDEHHQNLLKKLNDECSLAHINFWKTLTYNAGATAFVLTAAAISWPVAFGLTISYMAYRLNNAYQKRLHEDDKKQVEFDNNIYRLFSSDKSEAPFSELSHRAAPL